MIFGTLFSNPGPFWDTGTAENEKKGKRREIYIWNPKFLARKNEGCKYVSLFCTHIIRTERNEH